MPFTRNHPLPFSYGFMLRVGVDYCMKETEGKLDEREDQAGRFRRVF